MATLLILGATSDIGGEIARQDAAGNTIILAARRPDALAGLHQELVDAGAEVHIETYDATDAAALPGLLARYPHIDHAVVSFGMLGDHTRALTDPEHAAEIAHLDYTLQTTAALQLAAHMRQQVTAATITLFSSIAGFRVRRANFIYGATKAGLDGFCQGLADELHGSNVHVCLLRPGFVIGSMTKGMKPAVLSVYPRDVAQAALETRARAVAKKRSITRWVPRQLQVLAWITRVVPRPIWRLMPR